MIKNSLCTQAWLMRWLRSGIPGVLKLANGRLTFKTEDEEYDFDVPLREITGISFPWYYFEGGVKVKIGKNSYRFSFVQPEAAEDVPLHLFDDTDVADPIVSSSANVIEGRRAGKAWKSALRA